MSETTNRIAQARLAVALLTRLPVGRLPEPAPALPSASWAFPLCGAIVGTVLWAVIAAATSLGLPALTAALLGLAATALLTGALHEDGLADTADGFGGGTTRARKLEIMRDSRIGSYGVLALVLVIGLKATALAELAAHPALFPACLALAALSRGAMAAALGLMRPAREDGMGHAASGPNPTPLAMLIALALTLPLALFAPTAAAILLAATIAAGLALATLANRQIGGQTGDVLGALQQITELAGWLTLAALLPA